MRDYRFVLTSAFTLAIALSVGCPPAEQSATPTCAAYCASVTAKCTGGAAQYTNEAECVAFCDASSLAWGVGTADEAGSAANTLGCRQFHAGAANNDAHCEHAGPTGGGVCGAYCDVYCDAALANCTGGDVLYADTTACHAACANFPANGAVNDADGDSVQCRLFHLGAAKAAPADHCSHAGASGANVCGDWCEVYCDTMDVACPDEYTGAAACQTACEAFPTDGVIDEAEGDSVQCRLYHAGFGGEHCEHASADSTADTCGGVVDTTPTCASYCSTITANCTGGSEQYGSEADCLTACNGNFLHWDTLGTTEDAAGHSLGCREYHAGAAANDDHCIHAGPTGGGVCGGLCEVYCHAMTTYCAASYADYAACETACAAFPTTGNVNDAAGNTVQCRIFHAGVAYDDNSHCDHADADSAAGTCQ